MSNPTQSSQFQEILDAAKERRGDLPIDTMIVASHLAQMRTFVLRRGVEFYCEQDSYGKRKDFLAQLYDENMLEMKLDSIIDYFLCDGQGLFYFRPAGDTYQILYFSKNQYRTYRNQSNQLDKVVLIYSFNVQGKGFMDPSFGMPGQRGRKKFIRLEVFQDKIIQTISDERIEFDDESNGMPTNTTGGAREELINTLGFIPAVEIFNYVDCTGEANGRGEFDWLANQILGHDDLVRNIRKNMKFFGNPTLVSSRPKHDIVDSESESSFRPTISSQAGFASASRPSTKAGTPFGGASPIDGQIKVPRVIANLEPTDRVNYLTPDSVSGDQNMYVKQYRSEIRLALGGVDDIDINLASTAYEIKTLYGRVAATAEKKARSMFTFGLCKLMAMIIKHEEYLFDQSFAQVMGLVKPVIPIEEEYQGDVDAYQKNMLKYQKDIVKFQEKREELFRATLEAGEMPQGVTGLIPDGSTKVSWRWLGEVFEEDTQDILNNSIVVRNLQELGVDSIEALRYLFPGKTDEERAAMLTGYPFRMVQQTQQSLNSFIGLLGQLYQLPHPQTPNLPLASDPNLDITGFLYRSLDFLRKELSYSGRYLPSSSDDGPSTSAMPTADAQTSASQYGMSAPSTSQVSQTMAPPQQQAWAPQAPQAPAPQASAPAPSQGNPWQQAFQALSASLNTPNPSQIQAPSSVYQTTPTPQVSTQAQWASPQAQQTYAPQASTQAYAPTQAPAYAPQHQQQSQSVSAPDSYLSQISDTSLEVLEHFGAEAPALLNQYSCAVEDALIEQVQRGNSLNLMLNAAGEERAAMNIMLTDPDVLADYVNDFYGPNGPYPTETAEEAAASQQEAYRAQFEAEIEAQARNDVPPNFQRPQMEMPERGQAAQNPASSFWGDFSQLMDQNPENAWQYLAQAPQGALQGKMLIQDL